MVVSEVAAALVLLLATVALIQSLNRLHELGLGYEPARVFQARVSIPSTYASAADVERFYDRLSERLMAAPGVTHVGVIFGCASQRPARGGAVLGCWAVGR